MKESPHNTPCKDLLMANMGAWRTWQRGHGANRNLHILNELRRRKAFEETIAIDVLPHEYTSGLREQAEMLLSPYKGLERGGGLMSRMTKVDEDLIILEVPSAGILGLTSGEKVIKQAVKKRWKEKGPDVVWCHTPFLSQLKEMFPDALCVFDAVDDWREHSQYKDKQKELNEHYTRIKKDFDVIFTVSEALQKDVFEGHSNVHWIPNGIDVEHFTRRDKDAWPEELQDAKRPVIGYWGVIEDRIDEVILKAVADEFKEATIFLAGPVWRKDQAFEDLAKRPNVHTPGRWKYPDLPQLGSAFDVAIMPNKINAFTKSMNPLKLYEYLALGLPVVTTSVAGLKGFESGIRMVNSPRAFTEAIHKALQDKTPPEDRRALVLDHTWKNRVDRMLSIIEEART